MADLLALGYDTQQIATGLIGLLRAGENQRPLEEIHNVSAREERPNRERPSRERSSGGRRKARFAGSNSHEKGMVRLCMAVGRSNGLRPADVVYNIASKADIPGHVIGAIDIRHHETYLDVPQVHVDAVLSSTRHHKIHGCDINLMRA